jgi:hypothetical protein
MGYLNYYFHIFHKMIKILFKTCISDLFKAP